MVIDDDGEVYTITRKGERLVKKYIKDISNGYELDEEQMILVYLGLLCNSEREFLNYGQRVIIVDYLKNMGVKID